jgi:hypothetical protein
MALTFTESRKTVEGSVKNWYGTVTFDSSYPTGGEVVTAASVGMQTVLQAFPVPNTAMSRLVTFNPSTKALVLFTALSTEAANASDQSTITVPVHFIGY